MLRYSLLAGVIAGSFLIGYAHDTPRVQAAVVQPCTKYQCLVAHAWWTGNGAVNVQAAFLAANGLPVSAAQIDTFNHFSHHKPPVVFPGPATREIDYSSCTPNCPRVGANWLAPQVVTEGGIMGPIPPIAIPQTQCTFMGFTQDGTPILGPPSQNQDNQTNPGTPPGVPSDGEIPPLGDTP
jgi:hypothetical protein